MRFRRLLAKFAPLNALVRGFFFAHGCQGFFLDKNKGLALMKEAKDSKCAIAKVVLDCWDADGWEEGRAGDKSDAAGVLTTLLPEYSKGFTKLENLNHFVTTRVIRAI
jgi:hypothetical protein